MLLRPFIVPTESGEVVRPNPNKPEYGSIMFRQTKFVFNGNFLSKKDKVNFTHGPLDQLREYVDIMELSPNVELPGNIYTVERFEPFYEGQMPKLNPTDGTAVLVDGRLVYQNSYYDQSGTKFDDLIVGIKSKGSVIVDPEQLKAKGLKVTSESIDLSNLSNS